MRSAKQQLCEIHSLGKSTREILITAGQVKSLATHKILFAGYTDAGPGYRFVRHAPHFHQILAVTGGRGRAWVDGQWCDCSAGHVYLTASHAFCAYEVQPGQRWQLSWVIYDAQANLPGVFAGDAPKIVEADPTGMHHAVVGLCHEAASGADPSVSDLGTALLQRHALRLLQPPSTEPRLERLWMMVRQEIGSPWDLQRLARTAGMSAETLRRLCLSHYGRPPLAHLTRLRMQHAADLLTYSSDKIFTIAERVGYQDAFAFSNAFKRVIGNPPSQHRGRGK